MGEMTSKMAISEVDSSTTNSLPNIDLAVHSQRNPPSLLGLPFEIKTEVFRYLPPSSLVALQNSHSKLAPLARAILYEAPYFASTFRLAQFTYTITRNSLYGPLVHKVDLSELPDIGKYARAEELLEALHRKRQRERERKATAEAQRRLKEESERRLIRNSDTCSTAANIPLVALPITVPAVPGHIEKIHRSSSDPKYTDLPASWSQDRHGSDKSVQKSCLSPATRIPNEDHFYYGLLQQAIKIPIGFLFHILTKCFNLHTLNINHVVFDTDYQTQDYLRDCNFSQHEWDYLLTFHPTTRPVHENREEAENKAIHEQDLMGLIMQLKNLKSLAVNGCNWISDEQKIQLFECGVIFEEDTTHTF